MSRYRVLFCAALCLAWGLAAQAQHRAEQLNMELEGHHDLQGRSAYQPLVHAQGGRWIAYVGLHGGYLPNALTGATEHNGTAILDVTEPKRPKWIAHIPGAAGGGAQMVRVCNGSDLPRADKGKVYLLRTFGDAAHEVWDVTDPARPARLSTVAGGLHGTHKNWWECDSGIAYLVSGVPGWRTSRMTQIYDLADPAKPVFIRNFGLPGQQPGAAGPVPTGLHGPISTGPKGNRVYFGHGTSSHGILQIVDRDKLLRGPKEATPENLLYPQVGRLDFGPDAGAHTVFPVLGAGQEGAAERKQGGARDFVVVSSESLAEECREPRQMAWMVDVSAEAKPQVVASWTVADAGADFCRRGGRFGTHSSNESFAPIYYGRIVFFAHFNAGVRAVDIRDPTRPKEVGYYIPAATAHTEQRCAGGRCQGVIQTNNVEVDARGYIYIVDRARSGMHILALTGPARAIAAPK